MQKLRDDTNTRRSCISARNHTGAVVLRLAWAVVNGDVMWEQKLCSLERVRLLIPDVMDVFGYFIVSDATFALANMYHIVALTPKNP